MFFRDAHGLVSEQNRNALNRDAGEQELDGEGIAEAVRVAGRNFREVEKTAQAELPFSRRGVRRRLAGLEIIPARGARRSGQGAHDEVRQDAMDRRPGFRGVDEEFVFDHAIDAERRDVADAHTGISQQQHESAKPLRIAGAGALRVDVQRRQDPYHFVLGVGQGWPVLNLRRFQFARGIFGDPLAL